MVNVKLWVPTAIGRAVSPSASLVCLSLPDYIKMSDFFFIKITLVLLRLVLNFIDPNQNIEDR